MQKAASIQFYNWDTLLLQYKTEQTEQKSKSLLFYSPFSSDIHRVK